MYPHQELTHQIIASALEVHKNLGPGLLEAVYLHCLELEFEKAEIKYQKELDIPIIYKGKQVDRCFRLDFLVEDAVILELKSIETILPLHETQLLTYLRLSGKQLGLLINFNVPLLKNGIRRRILSDAPYNVMHQKGKVAISAEK